MVMYLLGERQFRYYTRQLGHGLIGQARCPISMYLSRYPDVLYPYRTVPLLVQQPKQGQSSGSGVIGETPMLLKERAALPLSTSFLPTNQNLDYEEPRPYLPLAIVHP